MNASTKVKSAKGSMAVYVSIVLLSMILVLTAIFLISNSVRKNQINTVIKVKETYEADNDKADEIYEGLTGTYVDDSIAAAPKVSEGMIPVKWNGSNWVKTDINDRQWYNYGEKKWANVVLENATFNGDILDENKTYSMLVWIPRFAYKITNGWHSKTTGTIDIVFIDNENKNKDKSKTYNTNYVEAVTGISAGGSMKDYVVHPAFDYGETKLTGFWVGKYESSNTKCTNVASTGIYSGTDRQVQIREGVTSWRGITISNAYSVCIELNKSGNLYGLNSDDNIIDPHMIKNTEWGAIGYLSKSKYGKETEEIWINNNSSYITGIGANSVSESGNESTLNTYKTTNGQQTSTTGNVWGIYGMSGGTAEYVASYIDNGNSILNTNGKNLIDAIEKHKDVYPKGGSQQANYEKTKDMYGDAIYETSNNYIESNSWYSDYSIFLNGSTPFFKRGGNYGANTGAGIFCFNNDAGAASEAIGFRIVISVL